MLGVSINKGVEIHPKVNGMSIAVSDANTKEVLLSAKKFRKSLYLNETFYRDLIFTIKKDGQSIDIPLPEIKEVTIEVHSKALGDQIAWLPMIDLFQKKHNCTVLVRCYFPELFKPFYPNLDIRKICFEGDEIDPNDKYNIGSVYIVGYAVKGRMSGGKRLSPVDCRTTSLQGIAAHQLGLEVKEVNPNMCSNIKEPIIKEKYVCITTCGTARMKLWNNPQGFPDVVKHFNKLGYKVIDLGVASDNLEGTTSMNGKLEWNELMNILQHAELMVSTTNGLQWLAWAVGTKVVTINGNSLPETIFKHNQVINRDVCHGCFNDPKEVFDNTNVNYCPRKKDFECSKKISSFMVINEIDKIL